MVKKFFKAIVMGLRKSEVALMFAYVGWLPLLHMIIVGVFKIKLDVDEMTMFMLLLCEFACGPKILDFILHCYELIVY